LRRQCLLADESVPYGESALFVGDPLGSEQHVAFPDLSYKL
jgi:hypothetical protein